VQKTSLTLLLDDAKVSTLSFGPRSIVLVRSRHVGNNEKVPSSPVPPSTRTLQVDGSLSCATWPDTVTSLNDVGGSTLRAPIIPRGTETS